METIVASKFKTVKLPKRTFAYIRNVGPYQGNQELFAHLFGQVVQYLMPRNLLIPGEECISMYHDNPDRVPESEQRISVGFTVPEGTKGEGAIQVMEIPAGKFFVGSFEIRAEEYGQAWDEFMSELMEEGLIMGNIAYESYKNDPKTHPENKHIVEICVSVF